MAQSLVQEYYRTHANFYNQTRWIFLFGREKAIRHLELKPDSHVLEVGCGTGLNFGHLKRELTGQSSSLLGLDFSSDMLLKARQRITRYGWSNVKLLEADATDFSIERKFDAILFCYSLSMIPQWESALRCAGRHLNIGGRLVVLDFDRFSSWGWIGSMVRRLQRGNHVDTSQPYAEKLHEIFGNVIVDLWLGGYNFTAAATKSDWGVR